MRERKGNRRVYIVGENTGTTVKLCLPLLVYVRSYFNNIQTKHTLQIDIIIETAAIEI